MLGGSGPQDMADCQWNVLLLIKRRPTLHSDGGSPWPMKEEGHVKRGHDTEAALQGVRNLIKIYTTRKKYVCDISAQLLIFFKGIKSTLSIFPYAQGGSELNNLSRTGLQKLTECTL